MTLVHEPVQAEQRFLSRTDWAGYLHVLEAFKGVRVKITYDRGALEFLTTSPTHEEIKTYLAQLVEAAFFEFAIHYKPAGATTFRREILDRGLEPDECYYVSTLPHFVLGQDPETLPSPDLALEIEVTRSALDRLGIYRALGVPEVWRYTAEHRLHVLVLGGDGYEAAERSAVLPALPVNELPRFVRLGVEQGSYAMLLAFKAWLNP